jgi:ADP-ribosylation factor-like protein 2-binding protein
LRSEEEEDIVIGDGGSREDQRWDSIVGVLESILMDESFSDAQEEYCVQHCHHFDDSDENKLVYTSIYKNYTDMIESRIESELTMAIEGFTMAELSSMLEERKGEICGDIWDMLMTIGDFAEFKNLMLAYKVQAQQQAGMRQQQVTASSSFLDAAVSTSQASFEGLAPLVTNLSSNGHL